MSWYSATSLCTTLFLSLSHLSILPPSLSVCPSLSLTLPLSPSFLDQPIRGFPWTPAHDSSQAWLIDRRPGTLIQCSELSQCVCLCVCVYNEWSTVIGGGHSMKCLLWVCVCVFVLAYFLVRMCLSGCVSPSLMSVDSKGISIKTHKHTHTCDDHLKYKSQFGSISTMQQQWPDSKHCKCLSHLSQELHLCYYWLQWKLNTTNQIWSFQKKTEWEEWKVCTQFFDQSCHGLNNNWITFIFMFEFIWFISFLKGG